MQALFTLVILLLAGSCFAQAGYTDVVEFRAKLGEIPVPYRTPVDTAAKPFYKLLPYSPIYMRGRIGTRWAIVRKNELDYLVRTRDLPAEVQQVVLQATPLKAISFDPISCKIAYAEVVPVAGASKNELYDRAMRWFANTLDPAQAVVHTYDKEAGIIKGGVFQDIAVVTSGMRTAVKLWCSIKFALKDGHYEYTLTDFWVQDYPHLYNPDPHDPVPAEGYIDTYQKQWNWLDIATSARRGIANAGTLVSTSIAEGMSKPLPALPAAKTNNQ
jgi:hypothetical protein